MSEIAKTHEPEEVEERWQRSWSEAGCFRAEAGGKGEPYAIMMPPPNVTGMLHMGHVLDNTLQDIFIRRARLEGKSVLWQPGTDHAGIATQTRAEKELLETTGQTKHDLGREAFLEKVREFRERSGEVILNQLKKLGVSCDWERAAFTLDEDYSRAVLTAFVKLYHRGHIYRGRRMVNWCPATQTAISDEEVNMKPQKGFLYKMRYELVEADGERTHLEISTTRPETLMGDTAVAVHPEDKRYRHLIGKTVWRPFPKAEIPIIGDDYVDREFGTGCLKVTPAHDKNDFEIGLRHGLETIEVIAPDGTLNRLAGEAFEGMDRFDARKAVALKLEAMGLLLEREPYENTVGFSERGDVPIEPRLSEQWFLKYPRVEEAKRAVEEGIVKFHPDRWKKTYSHWLDDIRDWCVSRQLWWGHRIPVWYKKSVARAELNFENEDHVHVSVEGPPDPENWEQEEDVLDTWASSYLWPMANLGWPDKEKQKELKHWYPTAVLVTGFDIIFFWVARMIMAGLELYGEDDKEEKADRRQRLNDEEIAKRIPFKNVFIHGLIRDEKGRKMSKSLGNSPDPLDLIEKFGADGLRFGICHIAPDGADILFSEERIRIGRNFCNKLWNAARFRRMSGPAFDNSSLEAIRGRIKPSLLDDWDRWILYRLREVTGDIEGRFKEYELAWLTHLIYDFFWRDFCDWYVEASKLKLTTEDQAERDNRLAVQDLVFRQFLQLAHPIIPHITEELWTHLGYATDNRPFIQNTPIPKATEVLGHLSKYADVGRIPDIQEWTRGARALKAKYGLANKRDVSMRYEARDNEAAEASIECLAGCRLQRVGEHSVEGWPFAVTLHGTLYLDLSGSLDVEVERARLTKELAKLDKLVVAGEAKLNNPKFVNGAPEQVVEGTRKQLAATTEKRNETKRILNSLG